MAGPVPVEKIAILGGGIAALATAFELTSQPGWHERFDITIHQMGWRLGGKCASSRGPNGRIEEHGIHGFLGSYFNALPMMKACYEALGRSPDQPLATFEQAFLQVNYGLFWEWRDNALRKWSQMSPVHGSEFPSTQVLHVSALQFLKDHLDRAEVETEHADLFHDAKALVNRAIGLVGSRMFNELLALAQSAWTGLTRRLLPLLERSASLRHAFFVLDYVITMICGYIADDIETKGFDSIDDENWSDWLQRHGANPATIASPIALELVNITYQYPSGDTSRTPAMAAGAYLHWNLRMLGYVGSAIWMFAAGTGEILIAPLYLVLKARGVKFAFFHKVEALRLSDDGTSIRTIEIAVQATPKDPAKPYDPIYDLKGLPGWPRAPFYDQLTEGDALRAGDIDLESYWTPWQAPDHLTLTAGVEFDKVVFAISIGAVPFLCKDLIQAKPDTWGKMIDAIPTVQTQALQIWLSETLYDLGWDPEFSGEGDTHFRGYDTVVAPNYICPPNGQAEFRHLLRFEDWPADNMPKSLWYFCGLMADYQQLPPFTDHLYPAREKARVRAQFIQYLQAGIGMLLPKATPNSRRPPADPTGLDFDLLVAPASPGAKGQGGQDQGAQGVDRIDSQFYRANIDPTERYVTSPPGSTRYRLKAWGSGFSNLVVTGDWIYNGLHVGSVEGAVMSGKLASYAISGSPALDTIIGYSAGNPGAAAG